MTAHFPWPTPPLLLLVTGLLAGCSKDADTAQGAFSDPGNLVPAFGSSLEDLAGWRHDYWSTYDAWGGLMTHDATGSTVSWAWDALFASIETDWYLNRWKWNREFEHGGLPLYYGGNEDGVLELFSPGEGNLRFILKPASLALAPELLGALIQRREALMKLRTTETFQE